MALALVGCGGGGAPEAVSGPAQRVTSPDEFWLAIGEEATVDGLLRIGVIGVPADSRCPATVLCPWEGDAAVAIHYGLGTGPAYPDTLHTTLEPKVTTFADYRITLLEVAPYPYTTDPIPADEYSIRLGVERLGQ